MQKDCAILGLFGLITMLGYGFMSIDLGGRTLASSEAWAAGVAQPYVFGGAALILMSLLLYLGVQWLRWPVFFWFPATFGGAIAWSLHRHVGTLDPTELIIEGLPVIVIWFALEHVLPSRARWRLTIRSSGRL